MTFLGISGMQYSGESLGNSRILLAEDSNVFTSMIGMRLKELFGIDIEICRNFEDLQLAYDRSTDPITLAISNINLPGAENGEALEYLIDLSIPTIVFTGTFHQETRDKLLTISSTTSSRTMSSPSKCWRNPCAGSSPTIATTF